MNNAASRDEMVSLRAEFVSHMVQQKNIRSVVMRGVLIKLERVIEWPAANY
jgi:hypothetical protein